MLSHERHTNDIAYDRSPESFLAGCTAIKADVCATTASDNSAPTNLTNKRICHLFSKPFSRDYVLIDLDIVWRKLMLVTKRDLKGQTKLLTVNWLVWTFYQVFFSKKCLNAYLCQVLRKCSWGKMLFERFWTVSLPTRNNQFLIILFARFFYISLRGVGFGRAGNGTRAALLLVPFFVRSLTLVPRQFFARKLHGNAFLACKAGAIVY